MRPPFLPSEEAGGASKTASANNHSPSSTVFHNNPFFLRIQVFRVRVLLQIRIYPAHLPAPVVAWAQVAQAQVAFPLCRPIGRSIGDRALFEVFSRDRPCSCFACPRVSRRESGRRARSCWGRKSSPAFTGCLNRQVKNTLSGQAVLQLYIMQAVRLLLHSTI